MISNDKEWLLIVRHRYARGRRDQERSHGPPVPRRPGAFVLRVEVPAVPVDLSIECVNIPIDRIIVPPGYREVDNIEPYIRSMRNVGLLAPIVVTPEGEKYRLVFGHGRLQAAKALGCTHIPAIIRDFDALHAELASIDENLIRQELPVLERAEQLRRRKTIYEALHPEAKGQAGPGRGHHENRRKDFASFAEEMAAQMGCTPRTIQQDVQIATQLSEPVKAAIRSLPIADRKADLLRLSRLPPRAKPPWSRS